MYTYLGLEPLYIPGTCLPFILVVEPSKTWYFPIKAKDLSFVFQVIYIYYITYFLLGSVIFTNHPENVLWQVHEQQEFESNHFLGPLGSNRQNPQNPRRWGGKQWNYGKVQPCEMALEMSKSGYKTLGISTISPCKKLVYTPPCFLDIYLLIY